MKQLVNINPAPYRSPCHDTKTAPPASLTAASNAEAIHEARVAQDIADHLRRDRIALIAYLMAEARGFEPGHAEEDWHRAETQVAAEEQARPPER